MKSSGYAHNLINYIISFIVSFHVIPEGEAVAASSILHHYIEHPTEPPLSRVAIFIGSPIPFSKGLGSGINARTYLGLVAPKPVVWQIHLNKTKQSRLPNHIQTLPMIHDKY